MTKKILGRDPLCEYVILDPQNRVSRKHAEVYFDNNEFFIKDLNSTNGTYINGKKISPLQVFKVNPNDKVTLSVDYLLDFSKIFIPSDDSTFYMENGSSDKTIFLNKENVIYKEKDRTVVFDRDKTQIGDISQIDKTPFISIGRSDDNKIVISNSKISRFHCQIRLLTPVMIEVEDLGSTNGTYADDERLKPNLKYKYSSSVKIRLGKEYLINLPEIFPGIQIIKKVPQPVSSQPDKLINKSQWPQNQIKPITLLEKKAFEELEAVWNEYISRQNEANNAAMGYSIGGSALGLAAYAVFGSALSAATGGLGGILLMTGGGVLGRYLGQQKSNEIRNDLTFEEAFLQTYACPRCQESFQKKPWITIRECYRCKLKFR